MTAGAEELRATDFCQNGKAPHAVFCANISGK